MCVVRSGDVGSTKGVASGRGEMKETRNETIARDACQFPEVRVFVYPFGWSWLGQRFEE